MQPKALIRNPCEPEEAAQAVVTFLAMTEFGYRTLGNCFCSGHVSLLYYPEFVTHQRQFNRFTDQFYNESSRPNYREVVEGRCPSLHTAVQMTFHHLDSLCDLIRDVARYEREQHGIYPEGIHPLFYPLYVRAYFAHDAAEVDRLAALYNQGELVPR